MDLLFDRLVGSGRRAAPGGADPLADSIARELGRLFNTRISVAADRLARRAVTVMDYGIPDLSLFAPADADARAALGRHLADAVQVWEPRLGSPEVTVERLPTRANALVARVTGSLAAGADRLRLSFELTPSGGPAADDAG